MIYKFNWRELGLSLLILVSTQASIHAQSASEPSREKLLNGLEVLSWQRPGDPNIFFKLRIHSGAAFDLAGKGGMMALLGDALFQDSAIKDYVAEQLGGRLEVTTTQDSIDVTLSGKASELERMIDLLRGALIAPQLGAENVAAIRNAAINSLSGNSSSASVIADQTVALRLFGSFPYAHPPRGTAATLTKVDRGDLLWARERFLNADNASLAVIGGFEKARLMRALRQLLGPWAKGDKSVPATFRQPALPDSRVLAVAGSDSANAEIRLAVRGLSRSDQDQIAAMLLAPIIRYRWQAAVGDLSSISVRHETHLLPGIFVLGASAPIASAAKAVSAALEITKSLAQNGPTTGELERARAEVLSDLAKRMNQTDSIADSWLDAETFKSPSLNSMTFVRGLTVGDVKAVAVKIFKDAPMATVAVGNLDQLKTAFAGHIEIRPAAPNEKTAVEPDIPTKKP